MALNTSDPKRNNVSSKVLAPFGALPASDRLQKPVHPNQVNKRTCAYYLAPYAKTQDIYLESPHYENNTDQRPY